jgi:hypothetical protein
MTPKLPVVSGCRWSVSDHVEAKLRGIQCHTTVGWPEEVEMDLFAGLR